MMYLVNTFIQLKFIFQIIENYFYFQQNKKKITKAKENY